MKAKLPATWQAAIGGELTKSYFKKLAEFVDRERRHYQVFPPAEDVFNAFRLTPYDRVKVLLLGQDPYHDEGQAHGLAFSVRPGVRRPPSVANIFKELHDDLGYKVPNNGYLLPWAEQGVMLLNAVLTVRAHQPTSHKNKGWETFTDAAIRALNERAQPVVFLLWGGFAQMKMKLIETDGHPIVSCAHPSPLSATKFFGSRPFSSVNEALAGLGQDLIAWQIADL